MALDGLFRLDDEDAVFVIGRGPDGEVEGFLFADGFVGQLAGGEGDQDEQYKGQGAFHGLVFEQR